MVTRSAPNYMPINWDDTIEWAWNADMIFLNLGNMGLFDGKIYVDQARYIRIDDRFFWNRSFHPLGDYTRSTIIQTVIETLECIQKKLKHGTIDPKRIAQRDPWDDLWVDTFDFGHAILNNPYFAVSMPEESVPFYNYTRDQHAWVRIQRLAKAILNFNKAPVWASYPP